MINTGYVEFLITCWLKDLKKGVRGHNHIAERFAWFGIVRNHRSSPGILQIHVRLGENVLTTTDLMFPNLSVLASYLKVLIVLALVRSGNSFM